MDTLKLEPEPGILIESLRDIGYSFNSALADIIDNSITAGARRVSVYAIPSDNFQVAIIDDGDGLFRDDLMQAMRLGSTDPRHDRKPNDLGRFGLGLKTASFSQCRRLTVASKCNDATSVFIWDLDTVVANNEWTVIEPDDLGDVPFIEELSDSGTLVLWEKVDRVAGNKKITNMNYERVISEAQDYLALVFHRYLSGEQGLKRIEICVNNRRLIPIDPFNVRNSATIQHPKEVVCPGVTMQAFTLPHRSNYDRLTDYDKYGLPGGYLKNQGVYLYRAKRLILYGTWFGIAKKTALTQLARVKIDIDVNHDEEWKIDVKKVSAQLPEEVRKRLKQLISSIGAPSKKVYRRRGARLTSPSVYPGWNSVKSGDKTIYCINRDNPVVSSFAEGLDDEDSAAFNSVLAFIESSFPTESLFYELSNNEESVQFEAMSDDDYAQTAKTFFATLKQTGKTDDEVLGIMQATDIFSSDWDKTLKALDVEEL
jgi:hypothetical protein